MSQKKLCIVDEIIAVRNDGQVAVFRLRGGDHWGVHVNEPVQVVVPELPSLVHLRPARMLRPGVRVWLDIDALVEDGSFKMANTKIADDD